MRRWIWLVVALVATSCSGPQPPEGWAVVRDGDGAEAGTICGDVEATALGSLAEHGGLDPVLHELSRLAAVLGATAALPAFDDIRNADEAPIDEPVDVAAAMLTAATALDTAGWAECEVPLFSAMYAATGWPYCHGEVDLPVTLYMAAPDPLVRSCSRDGAPLFLPCWQVIEDSYLPVDCLTDVVVAVDEGQWVEAGPPRAPSTTTTTTTTAPPTTTTTTLAPPPVIEAIERPECTAMADLFVGDDPLRGDETDLVRMTDSTSLLGAFILELASNFESATEGGWNLEVFEQLVIDLDAATVEECGIPLISAAYALIGGVDELPCWQPTGIAYPSYAPTSCDLE